MKPYHLKLVGFNGIASGRGKPEIVLDLSSIPAHANLVALVGPNGSGKSTIMDNLHPYRLMPSRSSQFTPGSFSFWENVGQEASKELIWEHNGRVYQSLLTFKQTGKTQKQECYLLEQLNGVFEPVKLADGLVSDGKTTSYDKCVESILGKPEVYFVAAFAAQKRKSLSEMGAAEIKLILSSVLGHEKYRELHAKAADIVKLLKSFLAEQQAQIQELYSLKNKAQLVDEQKQALAKQIASVSAQIKELQGAYELTQKHIFELEAVQKTGASYEAQRVDLTTQLLRIDQDLLQAINSAKESLARESSGLSQTQTNLQGSILNLQKEAARLEDQSKSAKSIISSKEVIELAVKKLAELTIELAEIDKRILDSQEQLSGLKQLREKQNTLTADTSWLKVTGESANEKLKRIMVSAALIDAVPCAGNPMQEQCQLLAQAKQAKHESADLNKELEKLRSQYKENRDLLSKVKQSIVGFEIIEAEVTGLQGKRKSIADAIAAQQSLASKADLIKASEDSVLAIDLRMKQIAQERGEMIGQLSGVSSQIESGKKMLSERLDQISSEFQSRKSVYQKQIDGLPKPFDTQALNESKARLSNLDTQIALLVKRSNDLTGQQSECDRQLAIATEKIASYAKLEVAAQEISQEIAYWSLIQKGFGNDGLVALSIDDCGPEISAITNQILSDCFGGRFTVRIDTQTETKQGSLKETFEVMVNDSLRGEEKPASLVSGGEGVWINESLTRAIALYQAQKSGQSYQTLFSDESDGPLDPEKKRQFIQMKKAVLSLGGYEREYFISQTPELWEMADYIIDVGACNLSRKSRKTFPMSTHVVIGKVFGCPLTASYEA